MLLILASLINIIFQLFWVAMVARQLGQAGLGRYSYALAWIQTIGIFADFGLNLFLTKEVAANKSQAASYLGNSLYIKTAVSAVIWMALAVISRHPSLAGYQAGVFWLAAAGYLQALSLSLTSLMRAHERMEYESISSLLFNGANLFLCFLALRRGGDAVSLASAYALAAAAQLAYLITVYHRRFGTIDWKPAPALLKTWLNKVLWLGLGGVFFFIYDRGPQILLGILQGEKEVGCYAAAYRMIMAVGLIPSMLGSAMLPRLSSYHAAGNDQQLKSLLDRSLGRLFLMGLAASLMVFIGATWLVPMVLGPKMAETTPVLRIMGWVLVLNFPGSILGNLLVASGQGREYASFSFGEMLLGIGTGLILIPMAGAKGAALAAVVASSAVNLAIWFHLRKRNKWMLV
jgi:O-antigen/teichoic acid export membrane protein